MRTVILGCGRVGATLAKMLVNDGHDVVIIDQNGDAFRRLGPDYQQFNTVIGDGTDEDVLRRAELEQADAFVAVTNGDNRNILAAQLAKHIFHVKKVTCRIYDSERQKTYNQLGLESISPTIVGAQLFYNKLVNPHEQTSSPTQSLAHGTSVPLTPLERGQRTPR